MGFFAGTNKLGNNGGRFYAFTNQAVYIDCSFIVDPANGNGLGIRSLKGAGVQNVFMHTSASPGVGANGILNPNPAAGYAWIQLQNNYASYLGGFSGFVSPETGSTIAINGSALTIGNPYVIVSKGHGTAGTATIAPVADVSGSLASTWFRLYDNYGNTFIIWFSVSGVGAAPVGVSGTLVQQSISSGATAAQVGAALVITIENLLAATPGNATAPAGVNSFTATGTTTVTVVSTQTNPQMPLPGPPADGAIPTGFTFALVDYNTNGACWRGVGLPNGVEPNVGAAFFAKATGFSVGGGSTGLVEVPGASGVGSIEVIGDVNQSLAPIPLHGSPNVGGWIAVQFLAPTSSSVTTPIATAPATNSVCGMSFMVSARASSVAGE
jgi:hypothetical protein